MKKRAIIYGVGDTARKTIMYLAERYEIIFAVDGDKNLWGKKWNGLDVFSAEKLCSFSGEILVTTTEKYFFEISQFLFGIGVEKKQVFRVQQPICDQKAEVIPYTYYERLMHINIDDNELLVDNSILIFCAFYSVYTVKLVRNMKERHPELVLGVLSNSEKYSDALSNYADYFYVYHSNKELEQIISGIPRFDVFQMLWIENIWVAFSEMLIQKCRHLNLCIGGSDFYRASKEELEYKRILIDKAHMVSGETDDIISDFLQVYPEVKDRIRQVNFGIDVLDLIDSVDSKSIKKLREKLGISDGKLVVTCGHNGNRSHQHISMIHELSRLNEDVKERLCFMFPMTYPQDNDEYINEVRFQLDSSKLDYKILTEFMDEKQMAEYSVLSDIMIHVQTTDQLSSTMLEEMYAGTIVIVGNWLPYEMLKKRGLVFWGIDNICELGNAIIEVNRDIKKYKKECGVNHKMVHELSSWDTMSEKWLDLWSF